MESKSRIPSLDGLRAFSIFLVVLAHGRSFFGLTYDYNIGNLGVRIFFVISGFLITRLLLQELDTTNDINLRKFYFRRTLRIFLPFYFFVACVFGLTMVGMVQNISFWDFITALTYSNNYLGTEAWELGHSWSLSVEEQFYLIFPAILLIFKKRNAKIVLILIVLAAPICRYGYFYLTKDTAFYWSVSGFHINMDALAMGCLLSLFYDKLHGNLFYRRFLNSKVLLVFPIVIIFVNLQGGHPSFYYLIAISIMNLLIVLSIDWIVTNHQSWFGKLLNSSPLVLIGMMSYSIYLWQQLFLSPEIPSKLSSFPINIIGFILSSLFSYYFVEKLAQKLRGFLEAI